MFNDIYPLPEENMPEPISGASIVFTIFRIKPNGITILSGAILQTID